MLVFGPITRLERGQSLVLDARGVNTSSDDETRMQELAIHCARMGDAAYETKVKSMQNREGTGEHTQYTRVMYLAADAGDYRCELWGSAKDFRLDTEVVDADGTLGLESVTVRHRSGSTEVLPAHALFVMIGARPHTEWLAVERGRNGFTLTGTDLGPRAREHFAGREPIRMTT